MDDDDNDGKKDFLSGKVPHSGRYRPQLLRTSENVALLNSFTPVEQHRHTSTSHLHLKGGGVYHSYFLQYLFTHVVQEPSSYVPPHTTTHRFLVFEGQGGGRRKREVASAIAELYPFVYRFNSTFISIDLPPTLMPSRRGAGVQLVDPKSSFGQYEEDDSLEEEDERLEGKDVHMTTTAFLRPYLFQPKWSASVPDARFFPTPLRERRSGTIGVRKSLFYSDIDTRKSAGTQ